MGDEDKVSDVQNWRSEAEGVVKDVQHHVRSIEVLDGDDQVIYLNVTTLEGREFCIELSASGFRVVGKHHGDKCDPTEEYFETPYSLLNKLSPLFQDSFGNELFEKLENLTE